MQLKIYLDWCEEFDIKIITLYVLSAENLDRKNEELDYLYELIHKRLEKLHDDPRLHKNKMRVKAIGTIELLPESIKDVLGVDWIKLQKIMINIF